LTAKAQNPNPHQPKTAEIAEDDLEKVTGGTFVKSWSTSGDADDRPTEEVSFYYNRIAFNYASSPDGKS
jgi:hypothetical protein